MATDIADSPEGYRFMTGAAAVALLVGVDAPLVMERERVSHIINKCDVNQSRDDKHPLCQPIHPDPNPGGTSTSLGAGK